MIRRVGYYSGRQIYCVSKKKIQYYHKGVVLKGRTWEENKHNIDNSFWVVVFRNPSSIAELVMICKHFERTVQRESQTTREEDVYHSLSLTKPDIYRILSLYYLKSNDDI